MQLRELFVPSAINLDLAAETKDEALKELVSCLGLDGKSEGILYKMLKRRENLGSTGIGRGIAIPHCRSLVVTRLRVAFGRKLSGLDFKAIDEKPVRYVFLIVAPPLEVSNQYLPVLGKIAQFGKEADVPDSLAETLEPRSVHRTARGEGSLVDQQLELLLEIQDLRMQRRGLTDGTLTDLEAEVFDIKIEDAIRSLDEKVEELAQRLTRGVRERYRRIADKAPTSRRAGHQRHLLRLLRSGFHGARLGGGSQSSRRVVRVLRLFPLSRRLAARGKTPDCVRAALVRGFATDC